MTEELLRKMRLRVEEACPTCKGVGYTHSTPILYSTDTLEERGRAFRWASTPCDECAAPDPKLLLEYIDQLRDAILILRAWTLGGDLSVRDSLVRWIDGGMAGPVPWPDCPFFVEWAEQRGLYNDGGYVARRSAVPEMARMQETETE